MDDWNKRFKYNPATPLANSNDTAIRYGYAKKIKIKLQDVQQSRAVLSIIRRQRLDGSWEHKSNKSDTWLEVNYDQYATVKQLSELVEKYRLTKEHSSIEKAADYLLKYQTGKGDIRGVYANQYSPNYTAVILELLIKAGYEKDKRVLKALDWLLTDRQQDGGWALAFRTKGYNLEVFGQQETIEADYTKPSSAMITGVVLRAMSVHPKYRQLPEIKQAGRLLADNLFNADRYPDRQSANFWTRFGFPFLYTDLISALDSLSLIGGFESHPKVIMALKWLADQQGEDGLFRLKSTRGSNDSQQEWLTLAICRIYMRLYSK
jgi:hypothetical protein